MGSLRDLMLDAAARGAAATLVLVAVMAYLRVKDQAPAEGR